MAALKPAKHQPNQGLEKAVKKMRELVLIQDHAKEKARYIFFRLNYRIQWCQTAREKTIGLSDRVKDSWKM